MLQVRVDVRFEDIPLVSLEQPVEIGNPALASPLTGNVLFISSEADIQKNTLQVKVAISDPPAVLKPEMLVDVTFLSPETSDKIPEARDDGQETWRIFVPEQLVWADGAASYVWLADRSEKTARKREVQLGSVSQSGLVEIISGLNLSSRLIAAGREGLTDGCRIRITGEDSITGNDALAPKSDVAPSQTR
jgi:predicted nicotinamide N-methyase